MGQKGWFLRNRGIGRRRADRLAIRGYDADYRKGAPQNAEAGGTIATPTIMHFSSVLLLSALLREPLKASNCRLAFGSRGFLRSGLCTDGRAACGNRGCTGPEFEDGPFTPHCRWRLCHTRGGAGCGCHLREGTLVRGWRRRAAIAVLRHPQRLGQGRLSRVSGKPAESRESGKTSASMSERSFD